MGKFLVCSVDEQRCYHAETGPVDMVHVDRLNVRMDRCNRRIQIKRVEEFLRVPMQTSY